MGRQEDVGWVCYEASLKIGSGLRVLVAAYLDIYTYVDDVVTPKIHSVYRIDRRNFKPDIIYRDTIV